MTEPVEEYRPGQGPAAKVSVSLRAGNIRAIKERVGARGFSAYVDAAIQRQIERDLLEEGLLDVEKEAGTIPQEYKDEAAALFRELKSSSERQGDRDWRTSKAS